MTSATNQDFHTPFCSHVGMSLWFMTLFICSIAYFMGAIWQCEEPWYTSHWHPKALQLAPGDVVDAIEISYSNPFFPYGERTDTLLSMDDGHFYRFRFDQMNSGKRFEVIGILDTADTDKLKELVASHDIRVKTRAKRRSLDQTTTILRYHFKSGRTICRKQYDTSHDRDYLIVRDELDNLKFPSKSIDSNSIKRQMEQAAELKYPFSATETTACILDTAPQ